MRKAIVCFVPVLHEGYKRFFEKHADADALFVLGPELTAEFTHLAKEIRALPQETVKASLEAWGSVPPVSIMNRPELEELMRSDADLVMPDEDIMRELAEKYLSGRDIVFDPIFLRWDKHKSMEEKPVEADQAISRDEFDREVIQKLRQEAERSSDWWRRIGAAVVRDGRVLLSRHNVHLPSEHSPYAEGDPRNNFHKGVGIEYSTVLHAEAGLIADAAREGIPLEGASMYVSTFPCPPCAKQIAFSGIKKLYYTGGYSILDQERILRSRGVEIIFVEP